MKSNREEIIKALECCKDRACVESCTRLCNNIPMEDDCRLNLIHDALVLIKELTDENERLNKLREKELLDNATVLGNYCRMINAIRKEADQTKAETVRKMQEKISAKSEYGTINISPWQLDQIAKEMLEENNG